MSQQTESLPGDIASSGCAIAIILFGAGMVFGIFIGLLL